MVSKARFILSVKNFWNETIYESQPDLRDAISPQNAYVMSYLLKEVVNAGTATKAKVLGRPVAGKTGTSNDWKDAWFIGFTPHLVTGMYVGYDQPGRWAVAARGAAWLFRFSSSTRNRRFRRIRRMTLRCRTGFPLRTWTRPAGISWGAAGCGSFYTGTEPGSSTSEEAISGVNTRGEDLLKQMF